jgi:hypothetical protein
MVHRGPNPTPETKAPGEHALVVTTVATDDEDDTVSIANESDDAFGMYKPLATTDEDLLHSIAQIQARRSESEHRPPAITPATPVPISDRKNQTKAKIAKTDMKWVESGMEGKGVRWNSDLTQAFNVLANQSPIYDQPAH